MIDVFIIDKENAIARFVDRNEAKVTVFDDEIRALHAVEKYKPFIIIVNYTMQKSATTKFISFLFNASVHSKIVLIAQHLTDDEILDCLEAGTKGYLQMDDVEKFINKLVKAIKNGEAWISRRMVSKLLSRLHEQIIRRSGDVAEEFV